MKARKIILISYDIEISDANGSIKKIPYDIKRSIADIFLAPHLKLNGSSLIKNWKIAEKILGCEEDFILLTPEEFSILSSAIEVIDVFTKNDVEMIRRIQEAEVVEVEEKKK